MKTFDAILEHIGSFGRYQKLLLYIYVVYSIASAIFVYFLFIFLSFGATDPFECNFPKPLTDSLPDGQNSSVLYSKPDFEFGSWCYVYDYSATNWTYTGSTTQSMLCPFGYKLAGGRYRETVISRFGLVCDKAAEFTNILTTHYAGGVLGGLIWAPIMDKLGRRLMIWFYHPYVVVICLLIYFLPSVQGLYAFGFLLGLVIRLTFPLPCLYITEFTDITAQPFLLAVSVSAFAVGGLFFVGIAYLATTWKTLILAAIIANAISIPAVFFLEKSPRWLLSVGKVDEAKRIIRNIIKVNKVKMIDEEWNALESSIDTEFSKKAVHSSKFTFQHLFTSGWSIALKTLVLSYLLVAAMMIFLGGTLIAELLRTDPLLVFAAAITMEIPGGLLSLTARYNGRVRLIFFSFLLSGAFSVATMYTIGGATWKTVLMLVLTRLFTTLAWDGAFMSNAEVFPTALRASGLAIPNIAGIGATAFVPYLVYAGWTDMSVTLGTFAGMAFLGAAVTLFLPETAWEPLIDTIQDEKSVAITRNTFSANLTAMLTFRDLRRRRRTAQVTPEERGRMEFREANKEKL